MISVDDFREYMKDQLKMDRERKSVQVVGSTGDDALLSASMELGMPKFSLEYEVLDKGSKGVCQRIGIRNRQKPGSRFHDIGKGPTGYDAVER